MGKISTKISSLALAAAVVGSGFSINASAAELDSQVLDSNEFKDEVFYETKQNVGVNDTAPGIGDPNQIVPYGDTKPTSIHNLSTGGRKGFSGYLNSVRSLYTDNLFTGKSSFKIYANNNDPTQTLKYNVMRKDKFFDNKIGPTRGVKAGSSGTITVDDLDSSSNYYIEFIGPCSFSGWIE